MKCLMSILTSWDVTLECRKTLAARLDAVLYPMTAGPDAYSTVQRLRVDEQVTAFRVRDEGLDDTFMLCGEGTGLVEVADIRFEGRALLLRRDPEPLALTVDPVPVSEAGLTQREKTQ